MTKKQERFEAKLAKRRATKGPTVPEQLAAQGLKFYSFVLPEALMVLWIDPIIKQGKTPNERLLEIIKADIKGEF